METFGAKIHRSPSNLTESGRRFLAENPEHTGSLGIAISEAVEVAAPDPTTNYALGSVLNHVLMHQTVIGEEALEQLALVGETPDLIVGCTGGGSNFGGLTFPFIRETLAGRMSPVIRAVEPEACPSLTKGTYQYDFGDTAGLTPLLKMHTLGHDFVPDPIHAGGLRYHGMAPLTSHLYELGLMEAISIGQTECFAAAVQFARTEGIIPAPEPTHALAACIREALQCKETGEEKVILTALCGHGYLDLAAYDAYNNGRMVDRAFSDERSCGRACVGPDGAGLTLGVFAGDVTIRAGLLRQLGHGHAHRHHWSHRRSRSAGRPRPGRGRPPRRRRDAVTAWRGGCSKASALERSRPTSSTRPR